ncbi:hypothetical protein CEXT_709611 [Caerostris extrusa]|uniref:Uncharacterized protein n=1 Tax=Caerostris extrusa TaxID=172846 RepID=A0AAV4VJK0_CAEEX|nr:hypothetical protein CEXT_709611 [Caerostris extrusa]
MGRGKESLSIRYVTHSKCFRSGFHNDVLSLPNNPPSSGKVPLLYGQQKVLGKTGARTRLIDCRLTGMQVPSYIAATPDYGFSGSSGKVIGDYYIWSLRFLLPIRHNQGNMITPHF